MRKLSGVSQSKLNKKRFFTAEEWGKVPLELKQRYWAASNYSTMEPPPELMAEIRSVINTGRATNELPDKSNT